MVGARGFEPPASWTQTTRAAKLRHAPTVELLKGDTPYTVYHLKKQTIFFLHFVRISKYNDRFVNNLERLSYRGIVTWLMFLYSLTSLDL